MIAWWVWPLVLGLFVATATVPLAGAMSGLLAGHGFAWPSGPLGFGGYKAVFTSPADPAADWPSQPAPGGPVLTWIVMVVCFLLSGAAAGVAESLAQRRAQRKHGKQSGLGDDGELLRLQMNEKGSVQRAQKDFGSLSTRSRRSIDVLAAAVLIGKNVLTGTAIYAQHRDCFLVEGPTGSGKTWRIAVQRCWDAPGFLFATTTKRDLIESTYRYRAALGRVEIFDPERYIGYPSPLKWSLLAGCEQEKVAMRRASALVKAIPMGEGTSDAAYWEDMATILLQSYLMAAAAVGAGLVEVRAWVANRRAKEPIDILEAHNPPWAADLRQIALADSEKSTDEMYKACARLLAPLADSELMAAVNTPPAESVDLAELVLGGPNTIYSVSKEKSTAAPFVAVFAAEVHFLLDQASDAGRLDPPARLVLDEVNTVAPIPGLPTKMNDSGGRGISIWAFAHNKVQNIDRWGREGGAVFTDSPPAKLVLPGLSGDAELAELSRLCGTIDEYEPMHDPTHQPRLRTRKVMEPSQIREMPVDNALLVIRGARPFLVHLPTVWDVKEWKREVQASMAEFAAISPPATAGGTEFNKEQRRWA